MSDLTDSQRLRAGARGIRAIVGPDAPIMSAIADGLDTEACRIECGDQEQAEQESLDLADSFAEEATS